MIVVVTTDGSFYEFATASGYSTEDDFNNLCLWGEPKKLLAVFADGQWVLVREADDG